MDEEKEKMEKVEFLLSKPKKAIMLVDKTMKGWNREKSTLPEDLHYSGHELVRLKVLSFNSLTKISWLRSLITITLLKSAEFVFKKSF